MRLQRLRDDRENDNDLDDIVTDPIAEEEEYGRLGEWTPMTLSRFRLVHSYCHY